jgi:hypothetical protein
MMRKSMASSRQAHVNPPVLWQSNPNKSWNKL